MNAKSLVHHTFFGLFQFNRLAKSSQRTALLGVRSPALSRVPLNNHADIGISEHEAIFLLQRRLLVK